MPGYPKYGESYLGLGGPFSNKIKLFQMIIYMVVCGIIILHLALLLLYALCILLERE